MMRPWYRSRLFSLGVPGLMFLMWGSFFSERSFFLTLGDADTQFAYEVKSGEIEFFLGGFDPDITFPLAYFEWGEGLPAPRAVAKIPPPLTWRKWSEENSVNGEIKISGWALLVLYLVAWFGLILGWQRRKARLQKNPANAPS